MNSPRSISLFSLTVRVIAIVIFSIGLAASCKEHKEEAPEVTSVTIFPSSLGLTVGEEATLGVKIEPSNAEYDAVIWRSSDDNVAKVSADGIVAAVAPGSVDISATVGGKSDKINVVVTAKYVPATKITVKDNGGYERGEWLIGSIFKLTAIIEPADATSQTITWKATTDCGAVDQNGYVTARECGDCVIRAEGVDNVIGEYYFTVKPIKVKSAKVIDPDGNSEGEGIVGATLQLRTQIEPEDATWTYTTWKTSNAFVAAVDSCGLVTMKGIGDAIITAVIGANTSQPVNAEYKLSVKAIRVTAIEISPATLTITEGDTAKLEAKVQPENASYQEVNWTSGNTAIATVDKDGVVTAVKSGKVKIYASSKDDSSINSSCIVTVEPDKTLRGISLDSEILNLTVGSSKTLSVTYNPEYAQNKNVNWTSSDPGVASVDAGGKVTAIKEGSATITATSEEGGFTAICTVTVTAGEPDGAVPFVLNGAKSILYAGETPFTSAKVYGYDIVGKDVYYLDSNCYLHRNNELICTATQCLRRCDLSDMLVSGDKVYVPSLDYGKPGIYTVDFSNNAKLLTFEDMGIPATKERYNVKMVAAKDGGIYFAIDFKDETDVASISLYHLDSDGIASFIRTYARSIRKVDANGNNLEGAYEHLLCGIDADNDGNVYVLAYFENIREWKSSYQFRVYRNDNMLYTYDNAWLNYAYCMCVSGSDVYSLLACQEHDCTLWKNDSPVYTGLVEGYKSVKVSKGGDIFFCSDYKVFKNGQVLHTFDNSIYNLKLLE